MGKRLDPDGFPRYDGFWWILALPQVILTVHLGVLVAAGAVAVDRSAHPWEVLPFGLTVGWTLWTLFEYALHRWLLHHTRNRVLRHIFWDGAHREHHGYPEMQDPHHHGVHCALTLPPAIVLVWGSAHLDPGPLLPALCSGWILGYWTYEALHWIFHAPTERRILRLPPFRRLYEAHAVHHLRQANRNYGFVTRFWDRAFGTDCESSLPVDRPPAAAYSD